jgi:hypothetical protein
VDQTGAMGRGEALTGLAIDGDDGRPVADMRAPPDREGGAGDVLHRQEHAILPHGDVVHGDDVGVREAGDRSRLTQQAGAGLLGATAPRRMQQLHGDATVELGVVAEVDLAHAADAEQVERDEAADRVAAPQLARLGGVLRRLVVPFAEARVAPVW